ncbi:phage portal protein [Parvibaculum sp.]|uniref:phage portal protein n=1 Tax=Parvibaculum sp. TaxID=2024848 RepID=UPI002733CE1C|nr:phage portal protein [Parvibaculum sp.]MDP3327180.1 phage portal protein [Parvibaculum sp.]
MAEKSETAAAIALNPAASAEERYDAQAEVTRGALADALLPSAEVQPVIDYINEQIEEQEFQKALSKGNIVPFPPKGRGDRGMQSVTLDEYQISAQGYYWDRPGILNFDSMRAMVDATPLLNAILLTRIRQANRFCHPQMDQSGAGFVIRHVDKNIELNDDQTASVNRLQHFMLNCGWETNPRKRKRLKRDNFSGFMAKSLRDTLTLDAAPIETEFKRDRSMGLDGFYAVDGGSIRLCTEEGYQGDDEIFALQVIQGRIRTAYTYDDLIYEVRNPRTDVRSCGYGTSETEMLIKVVTYLLNTMTFNGSFFDKNAIPRGILSLVGNYDASDIAAFKRYWTAMTKGIQNAFNLPVVVSKDSESKAEFKEIGGQLNEMAFGKWMTFLSSVACAIYGISPEEVSMESFSVGKSSLSGSDTEEKITSSNDKGFRPLLSYYENMFSDFIIQEFSPQYMFRFVGLDGDDAKTQFEKRKLSATWNEARAEIGLVPIEGGLGDAPLNPTLVGAWTAERQTALQAENEDFGTPPDDDDAGGGDGDAADGDDPGQLDNGVTSQKDFGKRADSDADFGKSYGLPIYTIEV